MKVIPSSLQSNVIKNAEFVPGFEGLAEQLASTTLPRSPQTSPQSTKSTETSTRTNQRERNENRTSQNSPNINASRKANASPKRPLGDSPEDYQSTSQKAQKNQGKQTKLNQSRTKLEISGRNLSKEQQARRLRCKPSRTQKNHLTKETNNQLEENLDAKQALSNSCSTTQNSSAKTHNKKFVAKSRINSPKYNEDEKCHNRKHKSKHFRCCCS